MNSGERFVPTTRIFAMATAVESGVGPALPGFKTESMTSLAARVVRVPVDDGGESSRFRVEVEVFQPMKHIQQNVANPDDFADRQRLGPRTVVDIPAEATVGAMALRRSSTSGSPTSPA